MNLLGQPVRHEKFGKGVIIGLGGNKVRVRFANRQRLFQFPEAFSHYLTVKDDEIHREISKISREHEVELAQKQLEIEKENNNRNRIRTMRIQSKAQVAYDLSGGRIVGMDYVETGNLLSGARQGQPRIPTSARPNSAVLLTSRGNGGEDDRKIIGIAMVDKSFWGTECTDGRIRFHPKHRLILAENDRISFWKYFDREAFTPRWGRVPFKYFENDTMLQILLDVSSRAAGTKQEDQAEAMYRYFCLINRIPERQPSPAEQISG